jgi:hypothetical protein
MPLDNDLTTFTTASRILQTINLADVVSGTGYIEMFGGATSVGDSSSDEYFLTTIPYYGEPVVTVSATFGTVGSATQKLDIDFDVVVNRTIKVNGNVIVTAALGATRAGSSGTVTTYFVAKLRKWDGTTETELGEATSNSHANNGGSTTYGDLAASFEVSNKTIKKGQTLRLTMEVWVTSTSSNTLNTVRLLHDPQGRTVGDADTSKLIMLLPTDV